MFNIFRKLEIFVIVVIVAVIGIIYAFKQKLVIAPTTNQTVNTQLSTLPNSDNVPLSQIPVTTIEYPGQDGKTALTILQAGHRVDIKHYSFGDMVIGIDGITPGSQHFWSFYVNGNLAQVGASSYVTKSTDQIKWQVDAVVDTTK